MPTRVSILYTPGDGGKLAGSSYTDGADTKVDEVMVHGEQHLPTYTVLLGAHSAATANSHIFQIMAGSTNRVYIRRIEIWQVALATTAALCQMELWRLSTAGTGGGSLGAFGRFDSADAGESATAASLPSSKGTESTQVVRAMPLFMQTVPTAPSGYGPLLVFDFDALRSKALIIPAGTTNGIALKNVTAIAAATVTGTIWLAEAPY